jgi:hypothetical protein
MDVMSGGHKEDDKISGVIEGDEPQSDLQDLIHKFIPSSMLICEVHSVMSFYDKAIKVCVVEHNIRYCVMH